MKLARSRPVAAAGPVESGPPAELVAQRERLTERFALMQSELGGLFYEMAIRDHVQMDVLIAKAAALSPHEDPPVEVGSLHD